MLAVAPRAAETDANAMDTSFILAGADLDSLFSTLRDAGYRIIGPTVANGVIDYAEIAGVDDLPRGFDAVQVPGRYSLAATGSRACFGGAVGPASWKRFLYPPDRVLWRAHREDEGGFRLEREEQEEPPLAFLGVRACDLAAIRRQDQIYLDETDSTYYTDQEYARRRERALIIAVNCTAAADTCFCASMGTGPQAQTGYDLALTELTEPTHLFLVQVGSDRGAETAARLPLRQATTGEIDAASAAVDRAAADQSRRLNLDGIRERLQAHTDLGHWDDVAARCLACGNCTMVCPTCFCMSIEDSTDLTGAVASRRRVADSCFNLSFAYVSGGSLRTSIQARYRQWLTHKFANWVDQFGALGCVGCGRCITWCPVGIDVTAEIARITAAEEETDHEHS